MTANRRNVLRAATLAAAGVLAGGCMSPMALKEGRTPDLRNRSIAVFTLRTQNAYVPSFQPRVLWIEIDSTDRARRFKVNRAFRSGEEGYEYLVSVDLQPGTHTLMDVMGESVRFPVVQAQFQFPVHGVFQVPAGSIVYVGHVAMVNRRRREDEPPSGRLVPLVDQAVAGYSDGTFDITITDRSEEDLPLFMEAYPQLRSLEIRNAVMRRYLDAARRAGEAAPASR